MVQMTSSQVREPAATHRCDGLPYKLHPLYQLRKFSIVIATIGTLMMIIPRVNYYGYVNFDYVGPMVALIVSGFFCLFDLHSYAKKKGQDPDQDPKWPRISFMICDVVLAVVMVSCWAPTVFPRHSDVWLIYGTLADLVCACLHAVAFWKQLMAIKKQQWLKRLPLHECARCGHSDSSDQAGSRHPAYNTPPNLFSYAGPSAHVPTASVLTPQTTARTLEEGLLINPDPESVHPSMEPADPVVEQPDEVIVGRVLGKKKASANKAGG